MIFGQNKFSRKILQQINHCKFVHHKSHLKPFLSYLPWIVRREYFSIICNVKKCTLYSIKYGTYLFIKLFKQLTFYRTQLIPEQQNKKILLISELAYSGSVIIGIKQNSVVYQYQPSGTCFIAKRK